MYKFTVAQLETMANYRSKLDILEDAVVDYCMENQQNIRKVIIGYALLNELKTDEFADMEDREGFQSGTLFVSNVPVFGSLYIDPYFVTHDKKMAYMWGG